MSLKLYDQLPTLDDVANVTWPVANARIRVNSDLGYVATRLQEQCGLMLSPTLEPEHQVAEMNHVITKALQSEQGESLCATLLQITEALATKVHAGFELLRGPIRNEVDAAREQIDSVMQQHLNATAGIEMLTGALSQNQNNFLQVNWSLAETFGPAQDTINYLHQMIGYQSGKLSPNNPPYLLDNIGEVEDIPLPEETTEQIVESVSSQYVESAKEEVQMVFRLLTIGSAFRSYLRTNFYRTDVANCSALSMRNAYVHLKNLQPILHIFAHTEFSLTEQTQATLKKNLQTLQNLSALSAYLLMLGQVMHHQTLVLADDALNASQVAAFEALGGTKDDIANYIRVFYNRNPKDLISASKVAVPVPAKGIPTDTVLHARDSVRNRIDRQVTALKGTLLSIKADALTDAYRQVMKSYIREVSEESIPHGLTREQFTNQSMAALNNTVALLNKKDGNAEDALYDFLLRTRYKDEMAGTIYRKLGTEYVKQLSLKAQLTDKDVALVDAYVVADMVAEFLVTNFVDVVK